MRESSEDSSSNAVECGLTYLQGLPAESNCLVLGVSIVATNLRSRSKAQGRCKRGARCRGRGQVVQCGPLLGAENGDGMSLIPLHPFT